MFLNHDTQSGSKQRHPKTKVINAIDSSKTKEIPDVSFDNVSSKENPEETIRLSRENPEVLSNNASERMVENEDAYCNPKHVQDAFVFCLMLKYIEMDNIMAQGFVQKNCPKWKKESISFLYKFSNITFEEKDSLKSKMQATEDIPNNMEINATKNISILLSMQQSSSVLKKTLQ